LLVLNGLIYAAMLLRNYSLNHLAAHTEAGNRRSWPEYTV